MSLTKKLKDKHPNFDIQVLSTELHQPLTQASADEQNGKRTLTFKSSVSVQVFEAAVDGKPAQILMKTAATGTSTKSMEKAEDLAIERAIALLGV